jgi:subtilase family serine protease
MRRLQTWSTSGLLLLSLLACPATAQAQSYKIETFDKDMVSIAGNGTSRAVLMGTTTPTALAVEPLPFDIRYFGENLGAGTNAVISPHGWMSLIQSVAGTSTNSANSVMPATGTPNATITPFWDTLNYARSGQVLVDLIGTAPNRTWIIEWNNLQTDEDPQTGSFVQGQVRISEGSGIIEFHYSKDNNWSVLAEDQDRVATMSIGIENRTGSIAYAPFGSDIRNAHPPSQNCRYRPARSTSIDLAPVSLAGLSPTNPALGATITVTPTIINAGAMDAGSFMVQFYASLDETITSTDTLLGSTTIASLMAGTTSASPVSLTLPQSLTAGIYFLGYIIDSGSAVSESDESNNTSIARVMPVGGLPDLDVISVSATGLGGSLASGAPVTITYVISNIGQGFSAPCEVNFLYDDDNFFDATFAGVAGVQTIPGIPAGATQTFTFSFRISPAVNFGLGVAAFTSSPGTSFWGIEVNFRSRFPELSTTNNLEDTDTSTTGSVSFNLTAGPSIDAAAVSIDTTTGSRVAAQQGSMITINRSVRNSGPDPLTNLPVDVFLSTDKTLDPSDVLLGSQTIASLAAAATNTTALMATVPANVAPGLYWLILNIDTANTLGEISERNNCRVSRNQVLIVTPGGGIDLTASGVSLSATTARAGSNITFTRTINNISGSASGALRYGLYFSDDMTITTSDRIAGSFNLLNIAGNASDGPQTITVTVPANLAPGVYFVGLIADDNDTIAELDESNNIGAAAMSIMVTGRAGDINGDLSVNAMDVQLVVNQVLGISPPTAAGDVNNDGMVNILDIQLTINILLQPNP